MSEANELLAFVQECGRTLAVGGAIEEFGVSRILACFLRGRVVKVGTNGSLYWVTADLSWNLPSDVGIMWAPAGTYRRAKLFELEPGPPSTGDDAFDAGYVVVGVGSAGEIFAPQVPPAVRQALLDFVDVRPDIGWVAPQLDRQLHVNQSDQAGQRQRRARTSRDLAELPYGYGALPKLLCRARGSPPWSALPSRSATWATASARRCGWHLAMDQTIAGVT